MAKISIIGCGWLGFPLAVRLHSLGHEVHGTTTHEFKMMALQTAGIKASLLHVADDELPNHPVFDGDICIVTIPPLSKIGEENALSVHRRLAERITCNHLIYTSSTSVYPDVEETMTEEYDVPESLLSKIENIYRSAFDAFSVLRFGGLVGPGRNPGAFLAGKKSVKKPLAPVNITCMEDAVNAITMVLKNRIVGIFNVVSPKHPQRSKFYTELAQRSGLEVPEFDFSDTSKGKIISSDKIEQQLNFSFTLKDPMLFKP